MMYYLMYLRYGKMNSETQTTCASVMSEVMMGKAACDDSDGDGGDGKEDERVGRVPGDVMEGNVC